jgi:hypothetical protein
VPEERRFEAEVRGRGRVWREHDLAEPARIPVVRRALPAERLEPARYAAIVPERAAAHGREYSLRRPLDVHLRDFAPDPSAAPYLALCLALAQLVSRPAGERRAFPEISSSRF